MRPFVWQPIPVQPFLDRQLRLPHPAGATAALTNLFASARQVSDVSGADLVSLREKYRLEDGDLTPALRSVFTQLLAHDLADGEMSDEEVDSLVDMGRLFGFTDREARALHDDSAAQHYRAAVDQRLEDRALTDDDRRFLDRLRDRLLLSEERARLVVTEGAQAVLLAAERRAAADLALSPDDIAGLEALAASLGVAWIRDTSDADRIDRLRRQWELDRLPLPLIEVDVSLPTGETAHLTMPSVRRREMPPAGVESQDIETLHGVIYHLLGWLFSMIGASEPSQPDPYVTTGIGTFTLTSKRLLFIDRLDTQAIPISGIRVLERQPKQLSLKISGHPWPIKFASDEDLTAAYVLLRRLIREDVARSAARRDRAAGAQERSPPSDR